MRYSPVIQAPGRNLARTTHEVRHDYIGQDFDCSCGCRDSRSCGIRYCATCASQPTPRSSPSPQTLCVLCAGSRLRLLGTLWLLLDAPARLGWLGLAPASRARLRLGNKQQEETERPLHLLMQGPIFWGRMPHNTASQQNSSPSSRQALPKFNPQKQPVGSIPNGPFTLHSREKQEPRIHDIVIAEPKYAGNESNCR